MVSVIPAGDGKIDNLFLQCLAGKTNIFGFTIKMKIKTSLYRGLTALCRRGLELKYGPLDRRESVESRTGAIETGPRRLLPHSHLKFPSLNR